jgi:adenosylcobinamide-phosphate synthase
MTFLGAFLALLWDQLSPLHRQTQFERLYIRFSDWMLTYVNAGTRSHGLLAWAVATLIPAALVSLMGNLLAEAGYMLGLAWNAIVLYQCLGFWQISDQARQVQAALQNGDPQRARSILGEMELYEVEHIQDAELGRTAVTQVLQLGLCRIFSVLFWFILFGPFGAVTYALTVPLAERWRGDSDFRIMIGQIKDLLDWLPTRLLAFSFAIVGNFEEAMLAWRSHDGESAPDNAEIVRAAGFGALGLNDDSPDPEYISGAAALLKRAALVWLGLLGLLWMGTL